MLDIPTLETARLRLRPYRLEDFEAYAAIWADPAVVRFVGGVPFTREASWPRFLRQSGLWHFLGFGSFIIEHKATGAVAGECGFHDLRRALEPSIEGTMEAGWVLAAPMQGQGIAEEAMRAAIDWADTIHADKRQTAIIDSGHGASLRVAEKLGFREFARSTYHDSPIVILERAH